MIRWEHREIRKCLDAIARKLAEQNFKPTMKRRDWYPCSACTMKEEGILYPTMDRLFSEQERAAMFSQMNIVSTS